MSLYYFIASKKLDNTAYMIGISVVFSYGINIIARRLVRDNSQALIIIETIMGIIFGLFSYKIIRSGVAKTILRRFTEKDLEDNMLRKVTDFDLGTIVQIYDRELKNFYTGVLFSMDERETEPWIALSNYSVYKIKEDGTLGEEYPQPPCLQKLLLIKLSEVNRVELLYEDNTKIFKQFT